MAIRDGIWYAARVRGFKHPRIEDVPLELDWDALRYRGSDKKALKATAAAAVKAGILNGTSAASLAQDLPSEITAAPAQGKGEFAVVVPPAPGSSAKYRVLPIKG